MGVWSWQLGLRFKQSQLSLKNVFRTSTGFEPMASVLALQCSTNWAMKTHTLGAGQFVEFIITVKGMEHMSIMWTADIQMKWRCDPRSCDWDLKKILEKILRFRNQLRWSHLHFICMSAVYIIFISNNNNNESHWDRVLNEKTSGQWNVLTWLQTCETMTTPTTKMYSIIGGGRGIQSQTNQKLNALILI